ncbi:MAG: UDP-3-O-(3-hydroxymyristoyl)glucosamine N-acyltransferase [Flavobacteriaceae bacterium]|nr:UDP-3-O-(3-hydroxymyristoyl)glucosamine N-acyltransferase [Flavobacteriaceae bacterium]
MKYTVQQIADVLEGTVVGNATAEVWTLSKIEEGQEGSISFLSNEKYIPYVYETQASAVIVNASFVPDKEVQTTLIKVEDAYGAFSKLLQFYAQSKQMELVGIDKQTSIDESATIGTDVYIGAFTSVGKNVTIGNNVKIYPNVAIASNTKIDDNTIIYSGVNIYSDTEIGKNCIIHSGAVIGSDGFGFSPNSTGSYDKIPQIGNVIIEDDVEIGATTTIDRATMGSTIIRKGVKLDNQIQVAHNVEIGENTVIAAQTGVAGSTKVGSHCMFGGQVGIIGHLKIGNNVKIQAQSGITKSIKDDEVVQGTPAFSYKDFNKSYVYFRKLPDLADRIDKLEKK